VSIFKTDFLKFFGEIKFAEEKSMPVIDFESSLRKHFSGKEKLPHGHYKFGEVNSSSVKDFTQSFKEYFK
jgi:hypothetical protein